MRFLHFVVLSILVAPLGCGGDDDGFDAGPRTDGGPCEDPDRDDDGHLAELCGGDDCNDTNPSVHPGAYDGPWSGPVVESYSSLTEDPSRVELALGADETAHVLVVQGGVAYYAVSGASLTYVEPIFGGGVKAGDIAVNGDVIHVVLTNAAGALAYRRKEGSADWVGEVVDADMYDGEEVAMVLDAAGEPHVVFDSNGALRYAARSAGTWTPETIETTSCVGCRPAIALDSTGAAHAVFASAEGGTSLRHASEGPGGSPWMVETLTMLDRVAGADVVIGPDDVVHAVVAATRTGGAQPVTYVRVEMSAITMLGLGEAGTPASVARIALGTDAIVHVVHGGGGTLAHATTDGVADPTEETVDSGSDDATAALALTPTGPVIGALARTGASGNLRVLRRVGMDDVDQNCDGTDGT
jgi:hypothetical protein